MTPQKRETLFKLLEAARQTARDRQEIVAAAPDALIVRLIGIRDPALCRRIASRPRAARRLAAMIEEAGEQEIANDVAIAAPQAEPQSPPAPEKFMTREAMPLIEAAIRLSGAGAIVARPELERVAERFGESAAEFALRSRARVPHWIRAISGDREDVLRQLAATCIVCAADEDPDGDLAPLRQGALEFDPLPVGDPVVRRSTAGLARDALIFLGELDASPTRPRQT